MTNLNVKDGIDFSFYFYNAASSMVFVLLVQYLCTSHI